MGGLSAWIGESGSLRQVKGDVETVIVLTKDDKGWSMHTQSASENRGFHDLLREIGKLEKELTYHIPLEMLEALNGVEGLSQLIRMKANTNGNGNHQEEKKERAKLDTITLEVPE